MTGPRVALNSYGTIATGLGTEARWLMRLLPFTRWFQFPNGDLGYGPETKDPRAVRITMAGGWEKLLDDIDILVCTERPMPLDLLMEARRRGIGTVVLTNPEWTSPRHDWIRYADVLVARTHASEMHLRTLHRNVRFAPVPIVYHDELPFTERQRASRVVFSNGWGGTRLRKGWPEVRLMLGQRPQCVTVYSQEPLDGVRHEGEKPCSADLYREADVMLVPSRFEGLGLTVLEGMASGCIVAATDAAPMSEFLRAAYREMSELVLLPVARTEWVQVGGQPWLSHFVDPTKALAVLDRLAKLSQRDVSDLSHRGRQYIEAAHGPSAALHLWMVICGGTP